MKYAKNHQRAISIATIDLQNAFGEVDHRLIRLSLKTYNIPPSAIQLFNNIYTEYKIAVAVISEHTRAITVKKGVLQGDPCSPLLFNICFNSLMRTINQPQYKQLGYLWGTNNSVRARSWLQFADDAIIVSGSDRNAQTLMNVFTAWCTWSGMMIRIDKCQTFGMRKENDIYKKYMPVVTTSDTQVPAVKIGGSFTYLGQIFNSNMNTDEAKEELSNKLDTLLTKLSNLVTRQQMKIKILKLVVYPRISFELKTYNFSTS